MEYLDLNTTDPAEVSKRWKQAVEQECKQIYKNKNLVSKVFNFITSIDYHHRISMAKKIKLQAIQNIFKHHEFLWTEHKFQDINIFRYLIGETEASVLILRGLFNIIEHTPNNLSTYTKFARFKDSNIELSQQLLGLNSTITYQKIMPDSFYKTISPDYTSLIVDLNMYREDYPNTLDLDNAQHKQLVKCILNNTELFYRTQQNNNINIYKSLSLILKEISKQLLEQFETLYTSKENTIVSLINILHLCDYQDTKQFDPILYENLKTNAHLKFQNLCPEEYHKYTTMLSLGIEDLNMLYQNVTFSQKVDNIDVELPIFT